MKHLLTIIALCSALSLLFACEHDIAGADGRTAPDPALGVPTMVTYDVSMLVSDSGVIRYRAVTPLWMNIGQKAADKYQYFPEGIHLEQLDSLLQPTAFIDADTAYNFEQKQLWRLVRNVVIRNLEDEEFHTEELYWDMKRHEVYSDSFIHIERPDATVIEGYGFTSNDDFSTYELRTTSGIFPATGDPNDTIR